MGNTKRGKRYLVLFLVFSLVITTCIANSSVPDSQAKKKKQTITILNKKKKGVLTIRVGKKVQLKVKVNGKKVPRKKMKKEMDESDAETFFRKYKFVTLSTCRTMDGKDKRLMVIGCRKR